MLNLGIKGQKNDRMGFPTKLKGDHKKRVPHKAKRKNKKYIGIYSVKQSR